MAHKTLLDVNICLDIMLDRKPHVKYSGRIFEAAENAEIDLFVSAISFDTMFYVMRPGTGAKKAVENLNLFLKHINVAGIDESTIQKALNSGWKDFEDALQYFSALDAGCDSVTTRNSGDFHSTSIPVFTPQDFISQFLHVRKG
ncbi:MAG: PIN domain-containing protein [Balneolales bacterium]